MYKYASNTFPTTPLRTLHDSFDVVCKNILISRSRLVKGAVFRGYNASKREYFYGYKVHLITAADGRIVKFDFTLGSNHDQMAFELLGFDLPVRSTVYADKAYNPLHPRGFAKPSG